MNIDYLNKIQKVDAPPYLFTRIQQKIKDSQSVVLPKKIVWAIGLLCSVILCVNISVVLYAAESINTTVTMSQIIELMPNNSFYR